MIAHLPECDPKLRDITHQWEWVDEATGQTECCICHALRACEQRVLDAVREAVIGTCGHTKYEGCSPCSHDDAVAAIDSMRGEPT